MRWSKCFIPTLREYHELDEEHQKQVDDLGSAPAEANKISDLAAAASFLMEVKEDPDLEALEQAVAEADRVREAADLAIDPTGATRTGDALPPPTNTEEQP